jgi:predicted GNAT superfamily acetyltransferase
VKRFEKVMEKKGKKFLFKVETSENHKDYSKYEELREEIWSFPEDSMPGTRNMICENFLHDGSSLFIAVYAEAEEGGFTEDKAHLVGFSYGFVGVKDKEIAFREVDNIQFYSQYTGVREDFQEFGLGILIKEFQKEALIDLFGIFTVTCTYDPLTGVNAYRNIYHFGMEVIKYRVDLYSDFGGHLNRRDIPSDRFVMSWDLTREHQRPAFDVGSLLERDQIVNEVGFEEIKGKSGPLELEVIKEVDLDLDHEFLLLEIPFDYYQILKETDVQDQKIREIPLEWRLKTRQAFQDYFQKGYKIIDFRLIRRNDRKRDFYILKKLDEIINVTAFPMNLQGGKI